jgi:hypothetical protein
MAEDEIIESISDMYLEMSELDLKATFGSEEE